MEEDTKLPIILGRLFLATGEAVIDIKKGKLVLNIGNDTIEFDLASSLKKPFIAGSYYSIDVINDEMEKQVELSSSNVDPLEVNLIGGELAKDDNEAKAYEMMMDSTDALLYEEVKPGYLIDYSQKISEVRKIVLKSLPKNLKYEFLGVDSTLPVIVNADLSKDRIERLLVELRLHRKVIGYSLEDIHGINPSMCMHRILLKEGSKPSIEF